MTKVSSYVLQKNRKLNVFFFFELKEFKDKQLTAMTSNLSVITINVILVAIYNKIKPRKTTPFEPILLSSLLTQYIIDLLGVQTKLEMFEVIDPSTYG